MNKFAVVAERTAQLCAALIGAIFLLAGLVYLYLGRWTVTDQDFWKIYDVCLNHTWLESALLKDNGHSLFFPSFIWLADLRFFHGNQELLFFVGLALLFITASLLLVPVWRDKTVGLTAKIMSTLAVIVGNFWMGRADITASGGFNCMCSLVMAGAAVTFLLLATMRASSSRLLPITLFVMCAGFIASFSFGTGLAIWLSLLLLGWCLRLPWRSLALFGAGALMTVFIYKLLPPHSKDYPLFQAAASAGIAPVAQLCRLIGSPVLYTAASWGGRKMFTALDQSFMVPLWGGIAGLALAGVAVVPRASRRDLTRSGLELVGVALVTFNLAAMVIIVSGRVKHFLALPFEVVAPRYLFWSTLFWTGLLLVAIHRADFKEWLRWPVYLVVLAVPVLAFPEHYYAGLNWRWARHLAESGATSLINGVRDERQIKILFPDPKQVYRVAEQLRARRLDMFADGLQDWIGVNEAAIFGGRHKRERLNGQCSVDALVECDNGAPAARVTGQMWKRRHIVPKTLIIVDPTGMICGVARSSAIYSESRFINRTFYLSKFTGSRFLGYIRNYNPKLQYAVRSADNRILSEEKVLVQVPTTNSANP